MLSVTIVILKLELYSVEQKKCVQWQDMTCNSLDTISKKVDQQDSQIEEACGKVSFITNDQSLT